MKDRPILFNGPMVRALLDGSKTNTRRIVKPCKERNIGCQLAPNEIAGEVNAGEYSNCPYGKPGDWLWVRESWQAFERGYEVYPFIHKSRPTGSVVIYMADEVDAMGKWRPSIHMPRWASRITLEIISVRVERLQDISDEDSLSEGIYPTATGLYPGAAKAEYKKLWESINGPGSWDANPLVWVVEFKRITP